MAESPVVSTREEDLCFNREAVKGTGPDEVGRDLEGHVESISASRGCTDSSTSRWGCVKARIMSWLTTPLGATLIPNPRSQISSANPKLST